MSAIAVERDNGTATSWQPYRDAMEMGRLAEQLGRRFEAKAFLTIALTVDPKRNDLRVYFDTLAHTCEVVNESAIPLASLLAPDLSGTDSSSH
jgi:hypothetical protein